MAILVVGGGGVAAYFFLIKDDTRGDGSGGNGDTGPRAAAQTFVRELEKAGNAKSVQDIDISPLKPVTCAEDYGKLEDEVKDTKDSGASAKPGDHEVRVRMKDFKRTDDGATFTMTQRQTGDDKAISTKLEVRKEDGAWKVCGLYDNPGGDDPGEPSSEAPGGGPVDEDQPSSVEVPPNPIPTS